MSRFLTRFAALIISTGALLTAQQTVWFTPVPYASHPVGFFGSTDYLSLFSPSAPWQQAASRVQVFKLYADGVEATSDADLTNLMADLERRNIALAIEWPVLSPSTCGNGIEGFGASILPVAQRIQALGGTLIYLAMQQPFQWGSLYKGANSCQWTAQQVAMNALVQINQAKTVFPNLLVGDIMAVPPFQDASPDWATQYGTWFDTWRSLAGVPLAFFHVDVDWTVPNWQAAVAAVRPVAAQRGIPFGMVYNGFLTDETDAAWMTAAENHFVDYEIRGGIAAPDQVNFQSWNPHPTHVLPETDPTAFTYLIDRYFRTRTQITLTNNGVQLSGTLRAGTAAVAGANIQLTSQPVAGSGAIATYTITGAVPTQARTAIVGARINSECYSCNGPSDLTIYNFQYSESSASVPSNWDFTNGINGWGFGPGAPVFDAGPPPYIQGLHITALAGQAEALNSSAVGVTPGAQFTLQVTARVSPLSVGSGYFTLIWFNAAGNEPSRETIMFQPQTQMLGTATTATDGSFSLATSVDSNWNRVTAEYAGSSTLWPALVKVPDSAPPSSPPSIASVTPFAGSGTSATFSVVFSDPNGWAAIANAEVLINADRVPQSGCYISYLPANGTFQLLNDAGTTWSSTALSNSQCSLSGATASGVGNNLTLTLPLTFQASFGSTIAKKTVFLQVTDSRGLVAPWLAMGVWYPLLVPGGACAVTVSPTSLAVPGTAGALALTLSGGSCGWTATPNVSWLTSAAMPGTSATLNVTVAANSTGAQRIGTLTIGGQTVTVTQAANNPSQFPALVSLNPFQGTGPNATLTLVYSHPNGWAAIQSAEFILNPRWEPASRGGGCYIKYAPGTGLFALIADDGNSVAGTTTPGSATSIANSQCTLNAANSSVTGSGNTLTVVASLTFQPTFTGQRHIWMEAVDYNNISTNWLIYGVWFPTQTTVNAGPWYRIYDQFSNSYLYTFDQNEYNTLEARGFVLQGISGLVMDGSTTVGGISNMAWYRVYVNSTNSHFWTSDRNEFLTLINLQAAYVGEGVAAFVMPYINALGQVSPQVTNTIPFYRAAFSGKNLHYWTPDSDEFYGLNGKHLPPGYFGEGIASYIFPASGAQLSAAEAPLGAATEVRSAEKDDGSPAVVSVVNGASYAPSGVIAPGQALTIYGRHLGGAVWMNGVAAEAISVKENEIRVVVPKELAGAGEVSLEVEHRGRRTRGVKLGVVGANPAIFGSNEWGRGNAQARNADGTMNGAEHPTSRGTVVTLYTTGVGIQGLPVEVHIGGWPAEVMGIQQSATGAGVMEVQVRVPDGVEAAAFQPVVLHVGNQFSQPGVGLAIW